MRDHRFNDTRNQGPAASLTGMPGGIIRLRRHFIALSLALSPMLAVAQPISWVRYQVPETGAAVDLPTSIFTEDAGKPADGYGARFLTSDQRADLTVQSVANDSGFS